MSKNFKRIDLTHYELLELMAVVRVIKSAAVEQRNVAEVHLMDDLTDKLLKFDIDTDGAVLKLSSTVRYSLWLCIEKYITFCADTKQHDGYVRAVTIATKLSG